MKSLLLTIAILACLTGFSQTQKLRYTVDRSYLDSASINFIKSLNIVDSNITSVRRPKSYSELFAYARGLVLDYQKDVNLLHDYIGYWKYFSFFGKLKYELYLNPNWTKQGIKIDYFRNGLVEAEIDFGLNENNDCCNYYGIWYNRKGLIEREGQIQDGNRVGKWLYYENGIQDHFIDYTNNPETIVKCK